MEQLTSIRDIFEFAIAREIESYTLYSHIAKMIREPTMREIFEGFAADEVEHRSLIELELMKQGETVADLDLTDYDVEGQFDAEMSIEDAFLLAMNKEKASFRLYINLMTMVEGAEFRELLLALAEEEARHKVHLELQYEDLMSK